MAALRHFKCLVKIFACNFLIVCDRYRATFVNHYVMQYSRVSYFSANNSASVKTKLNSVALVRERTIPTERPPPVGEVSANFCGQRGVALSAQRVKLCFLDLEPLLFYSSSSSIDLRRLTRLSRPRSRPTTTQKNLVVPGIEPGTSVSVARNSDHQTTEAVQWVRSTGIKQPLP